MIKALAPGFLLTLALGVVSFFISNMHDTLDALVVALLAGMLVRLLFGTQKWFILVVAYAKDLKVVLIPIGVLLYSATININKSLTLSGTAYLHTLISFIVLLGSALLFGKLFRLPQKTSWLTAVGSAVCGASAIAITSTAIDAKDEDISNSMIAITLVGLLAVVLYLAPLPLIAGLDRETYAVLSGATLQQTGMVKIAASSLGSLAKDIALPVKVLRTASIPFVALAFFYFTVKKEGFIKGRRYFIAVLAAFIVILGLTGLSPQFALITHLKGVKIAATIVFATAFANMGLLVDFKAMKIRPVIVALLAWVASVAVFLLMS
jgi:uncharacterized integral membrane protein (TIGR00698 family)